MPKPEQTEKATPKRRSEARKRGQIARSQELAGSFVFLSSILVLHAYGTQTMGHLDVTMQSSLAHAIHRDGFTLFSVWSLFAQTFGGFGMVLVVMFALALVIGLIVNLFQVGFLFTFKPITPSFTKINPLTGFQRLFSKQILVNLAKQIIKLVAVIILINSALYGNRDLLVAVGGMTPAQMFVELSGLVYDVAWRFGLFLIIIALADYLYERYQYEQNLKMTKQEVKDEARQAEGNPEVRGAVKRRQREFARRRMMQAVPRATVIVTNPTHYAIALEWDEVDMDAPVVLAKGTDLIALRIREIAMENRIPILENPPLARTLYEKVELNAAVPPHLYAAVAQVIAFVYRMKRKTIA